MPTQAEREQLEALFERWSSDSDLSDVPEPPPAEPRPSSTGRPPTDVTRRPPPRVGTSIQRGDAETRKKILLLATPPPPPDRRRLNRGRASAPPPRPVRPSPAVKETPPPAEPRPRPPARAPATTRPTPRPAPAPQPTTANRETPPRPVGSRPRPPARAPTPATGRPTPTSDRRITEAAGPRSSPCAAAAQPIRRPTAAGRQRPVGARPSEPTTVHVAPGRAISVPHTARHVERRFRQWTPEGHPAGFSGYPLQAELDVTLGPAGNTQPPTLTVAISACEPRRNYKPLVIRPLAITAP
ncbi:proline-rich protein 2-like [Formica exsecta]|uniref:proline-rich protein 2-like n=1 Tax=Formica exsecta TaxID=72781 RepID=UPI0011422CC1|nr:proline-rich protein 2-like [Formica exsecta]